MENTTLPSDSTSSHIISHQQNYVEQGGVRCPCCGSDEISGGTWNADAGYATQEVGCDDCHAEWQDEYSLTGFTLQSGVLNEPGVVDLDRDGGNAAIIVFVAEPPEGADSRVNGLPAAIEDIARHLETCGFTDHPVIIRTDYARELAESYRGDLEEFMTGYVITVTGVTANETSGVVEGIRMDFPAYYTIEKNEIAPLFKSIEQFRQYEIDVMDKVILAGGNGYSFGSMEDGSYFECSGILFGGFNTNEDAVNAAYKELCTNSGNIYGSLLRCWNIEASLVNIGEGLNGDYDPNDPNDIPLLRFNLNEYDSDGVIEADGSACCQLSANSTYEQRHHFLELALLTALELRGRNPECGWKHLAESISHCGADWDGSLEVLGFKPIKAPKRHLVKP